jgi:L-serine dehydratase
MHTLIIKAQDVSGAIAFISSVIAQEKANIATMSVSRKGKNDLACHVIEMDSGINPITIEYLKSLPWIKELIYIPDIDL